MRDLLDQIQLISRAVSRRREPTTGELVAVTMHRSYDAAVADVWSAITDPARLARWMYPITGELRLGGSFQFEGNAGGTILACEPPRHLRITFGMASSVVTVRLSTLGARTQLALEHTVPIEIAQSVAGAFWVGPGWDLGLVSLARYLRDALGDAAAYRASPEAQLLMTASIDAWASTVAASGATPDEVTAGRLAAAAQFTPTPG